MSIRSKLHNGQGLSSRDGACLNGRDAIAPKAAPARETGHSQPRPFFDECPRCGESELPRSGYLGGFILEELEYSMPAHCLRCGWMGKTPGTAPAPLADPFAARARAMVGLGVAAVVLGAGIWVVLPVYAIACVVPLTLGSLFVGAGVVARLARKDA